MTDRIERLKKILYLKKNDPNFMDFGVSWDDIELLIARIDELEKEVRYLDWTAQVYYP